MGLGCGLSLHHELTTATASISIMESGPVGPATPTVVPVGILWKLLQVGRAHVEVPERVRLLRLEPHPLAAGASCDRGHSRGDAYAG
jgi:hypothetical protein